MSSAILSSFDAFGSLLATVVTSLSSHKVQVQSVKSSGSSSLSTSFLLDKGVQATCLSWGFVTAQTNSVENQILIVGTSDGKVLLYSPFTNALIETLHDDFHDNPIVDVHFASLTNSIWSIDSKNVALEWSLATFQRVRVIQDILKSSSNKSASDEALQHIQVFIYNNDEHLLLVSHKVHVYNLKANKLVHEISNHITPVNQVLFTENYKYLITSAKSDRYVNVYDVASNFKPVRVLVTQANVENIAYGTLNNNKQAAAALTAITEDGVCEVFYNPVESSAASSAAASISDGTSRRKKRQSQGGLSRNSNSQVKLSRPETDTIKESLPIIDSIVLNDQILIGWFENATIPYFDIISWFNKSDNQYALDKLVILTKSKPVLQQINHSTYGHDVAASNLYNENNVFLTVGDNYKDLDDDEHNDVRMKIDQNEVGNEESFVDEDPNETLGDKLFSLNPNAKAIKKKSGVNRSSTFDISSSNNSKPTTGSLTIVLTQALKSNDHSLLESVLSTKDETVIKQTIKNLSSDLSIILLDKLSEKYNFISSVSASSISYQKQIQLNYWIKWVLIIHGSYLKINEINNGNNNKQLLKNLSFLLINLNKKSGQLSKILLLQNKLDAVFEKINYKNELLNDFVTSYQFNSNSKKNKSKANNGGIIRYNDFNGADYADSEEDTDVEYNEELDDANLMDDGEADFSEEEDDEIDEERDDFMELDDESNNDDEEEEEAENYGKDLRKKSGKKATQEELNEDEYGNSDVEIDTNGNAANEGEDIFDSDDEKEQEYQAKINNLKQKSKSKSKRKSLV